MFRINHSQRDAFNCMRQDFEKALGLSSAAPTGVAVFETESSLILEVDLPGVDRSDVELVLEKDVLRITAERKAPEIEGATARDHRRFGQFERAFRLGFAVDPQGIDAVTENGVLRITLPKAAEEQPQKITIRTTEASGS